jgi:hypothetical protein
MMETTRHGNRLVITVRPDPSDDGLLPINEAFQQVLDALKLFEQAARSLGILALRLCGVLRRRRRDRRSRSLLWLSL